MRPATLVDGCGVALDPLRPFVWDNSPVQRRPPQHEPPPSAACRAAPRVAGKADTQESAVNRKRTLHIDGRYGEPVEQNAVVQLT